MVVVVFSWQRVKETREAQITPTPTTSFLFDLGGKTITGIAIEGSSNQVVSALRSSNGSWTLVEPDGEAADSSRLDSAIGAASGFQVLSTLNKPVDLETLGLNPASYHIDLVLDDGSKLTAFIGSLTPIQNGYNVFVEGQPLKIVDRVSVDNLIALITDPPILQPTPTGGGLSLPTSQP